MEHLEVQNFCMTKAAQSIGNRKRKFEELQYENLQKGLEAQLSPQVKQEATSLLNGLKQKLGKNDYENDALASFDSKYPGVYQKSWTAVEWKDIVLPQQIKNKLRSIALISLEHFNVQPRNCRKGPKRSIFLYGVPGLYSSD